ncbi:MAG TPA: ribonuclease Z [Anaerolineae bacterium]|nr:ribonuclease Z [Anaerolineae bacterium]
MFELVFLGTSASAPSVRRGLTASMVLHKEYRFLIDCGEGTQRQLLKSGLGFKRLDKILLTHGHLDHILGLGGLVSTFSRWEAIEKLEIYGGKWALDRVEDLIFGVVLRGARPPMKIELFEVKPGVLMEDNTFELSAFLVSHRGPGCFGYAFREKAKRPFLVEKAEALGVPSGPERGRLVRGESITLADGTVVHPDQVLGEPVPGAALVYVGDAGRTDDLVEVCRGADAVVIEATYLEVEADMARRFGHLTAAQAATLARRADIKQLFLTHISRRYSEREVLAEAEPIFPNTVVARDFDRFRIIKEK